MAGENFLQGFQSGTQAGAMIAEGQRKSIENANDYAKAMADIDVRKSLAENQKYELETKRQELDQKTGEWAIDSLDKISKMPSRFRATAVKTWAERSSARGIKINEDYVKYLSTADDSEWADIGKSSSLLLQDPNNEEASKNLITGLGKILPQQQVIQYHTQIITKAQEIAAQRQQKADELLVRRQEASARTKTATALMDERKEKAKEAEIKKIRDDVQKIEKPFVDKIGTINDIRELIKNPATANIPPTKDAVVRLVQSLTEARKSIVTEKEFERFSSRAGIIDRMLGSMKGWTDGDPIPTPVIEDLEKVVDVLGLVQKKNLAKALSREKRRVKERGFSGREGEVFSDYSLESFSDTSEASGSVQKVPQVPQKREPTVAETTFIRAAISKKRPDLAKKMIEERNLDWRQ